MAFYDLGGIFLNVDYVVAFCEDGHIYADNDIKLATLDFADFICINQECKGFISVNLLRVDLASNSTDKEFNQSQLAFVNTKYIKQISLYDEHRAYLHLDHKNDNYLGFLIKESLESLIKKLQVFRGQAYKERISNAKNVIVQRGWTLNNIGYDDRGTILKVRCEFGHEFTATPNQIGKTINDTRDGIIAKCKGCEKDFLNSLKEIEDFCKMNQNNVYGDISNFDKQFTVHISSILDIAKNLVNNRGDKYLRSFVIYTGSGPGTDRISFHLCAAFECSENHKCTTTIAAILYGGGLCHWCKGPTPIAGKPYMKFHPHAHANCESWGYNGVNFHIVPLS